MCVPGTIADYVALTSGCRSGGVTVSDFLFHDPGGSALDLFVTPVEGVSEGSLRLVLSIGGSLDLVGITFTATAESPVIHKLGLAFVGPFLSDFSTAGLNGVGILAGLEVPPTPLSLKGAATGAFAPVAVKDFDFFFNRGLSSSPHAVALDVVTPEPTTLLLWGAGAAGAGLIRWRRRQRAKAQATLSDSRKGVLTRALLPMLIVVPVVLMPTPARAIPTCSAGTMADYIALTDGCRLGAITVSNFSYSGFTETFGQGPEQDFVVSPSFVMVTPSLPFGASSLRLTFTSNWTGVEISYTAQAEAPWIRQFNLSFLDGGRAGVGANGLFVFMDPSPFGGPSERFFDTRSFDPISLTTVHIAGGAASHPFGGLNSFAFDTVTPEPATLLLWGTGAAGLGVARWLKKRRRTE
jgi:hypothetical protein